MNVKKRLIACILAVVQMCLFCMPVLAAEGEAGYAVRGEYLQEQGLLKVTIALQNVNALVGRFALQFDQTKLELVGNSLSSAIVPSKIVLTAEGIDESKLISQKEGHVMFAWYCSGSRVEAAQANEAIAEINFKLKHGVTAADLDGATLAVRSLQKGDCGSWVSGAYIRDENMTDYQSNVSNNKNCAVRFAYPCSEAVPPNAAQAVFTVTDWQGKPVQATILMGSREFVADSLGRATCWLVGKQTYRVSFAGHESVVGQMVAEGENVAIKLKSDLELVKFVASSLAIGYAEGDSAARVSASLELLTAGVDGTTIRWESNFPGIIAPHGSFFAPAENTKVTLTATASKNGMTAQKNFEVMALAKASGGIVPTPDKKTFSDLEQTPWAKEAILALANNGIINGKTATTFDPNGNITRGDFICMLMRMISPTGDTSSCFSDVPKNSYYYNEIAIAKSMGVAQGSGNNLFMANDAITRQDMMTLTFRALDKMKLMPVGGGMENPIAQFEDSKAVADYAVTAVEKMVDCGLIKGSGGKIEPQASTTRAETAVMLYRIFKTL